MDFVIFNVDELPQKNLKYNSI